MRIVHINTVPNGSTGTIMMNIHQELLKEGYESYVVWGRGRKAENKTEIYMNDKLGVYFHAVYSRLTGKTGFASRRATKKLLNRIEEIKPDIIHLHNIHGYYINIELLFNYIKEKNIKVVWTLHDCWAFTGHCSHFEYVGCEKWKEECKKCKQLKQYPKALIDNSKWCYKKKKELFTGVKNLTIITPSDWLKNLVKQSFLKDYNTITIHNGIDTTIFKPIAKEKLQFRKNYGLEDKKIILGVASVWNERKGLNDFIELSKILDDEYIIVLVGLNKKQIKKMPANIIGIERTENVYELVDIYNSADVFFNPTHEDNYPTVNLEALAVRIPVFAYCTGACKEQTSIDSNMKIVTSIEDFINQYTKNYFYIKNIENKEYIENQYLLCDYFQFYREDTNEKNSWL